MNLRLANNNDLTVLEEMYNSIIENMYAKDIKIWHQYYPFDEFEFDIKNKKL